MSSDFLKNKEKRTHTSSNEANNSFVKNVTSRVSGLLPSTITKWFSSPSSSNANGSAQMADASDSSTEDEACETPVITQPPAKRMKYSSPSSYSHYGSSEAHCSTSNMEITELPYNLYSSSQFSQSSRNTFQTSFPSSNEDPSKDKNDRDMKMFRTQHTVAGIGQSIANKRKSIFESTSNQEEDPNTYPKPSPNSSRQNEPKQSKIKPSLLGSPFYPGRTMYGGAASSYINQPNITQHRVAVVNEPKMNEDIAMSSAARRVLEILESSSPLTEARRIPVYTRPKNDKFYTSSEQPLSGNRSYSYKTQELHVPNYASILRLKKKSRLMDTTNAARQIIASQSSTSNYPSYPSTSKGNELAKEQSHKLTTKMKTKITKINRGCQDDDDVATPVILPTGVLKINKDQMPTISFGIPVIHKAPISSTPKAIPVKNFMAEKARKPEKASSSDFIFASPVKVSSDTPEVYITPPKFTFGSPEQQIDKKIESKHNDCSTVDGNPKEIEKSTSTSKEWQCPDCWVKNKPVSSSCVCCGHKQPSQNTKCTVCKLADSQSQKDKCVNCEKIVKGTEPVSTLATGISQSAKWKCEDCWVSNDESAGKCACCGSRKPSKPSGVPTHVISNISSTSSQSADWKCEDCWISNKISVDKCAACGGAKPGSKQNNNSLALPKAPSLFGSNDDKFKKIIESQKSAKWECSDCLVRNDSDITKCACCGQAKEGTNKMPESKFNFDTSPNNSFKFGIDPKVQEAAKAKMPELKSTLDPKLKEHSETNNNVLSETPSFTFTLPTKVVDNKTDKTINSIPNETPKMMFSFGIPKPIAVPASVNKLSETKKVEDNEKNQEVPSVDLNSVNDKPKQSVNLFMTPPAKLLITNEDKKETTPVSGISLQNPLPADGKKETVNNSAIVQPSVTTADSSNKPAYNFGLKPSTKLFETPAATTAGATNLFAQQTTHTTSLATNSAPAMSLFKTPESTTTTASLFQPPDRSSVTSAALFPKSDTNNTVTTAPVFSFGASAQNNSSLPSTQEKPKFQFNFGSNTAPKTETALFKSPFGSTENNSTTNSFTLPQGATLGSANPLPSSTGSNGLSAPNGLTGNALGAMPGIPLMGSSLPSGNSLTTGNSVNPALGGANGLSVNPLSGGNTMTGGTTTLFGNPIKNENMWSTANTSSPPNMFVTNTATSSLQKPATFTFGSSTSFTNPPQPAFGNNTAQSSVMFGMNNQNNNNNQSLMFSNAAPSQPSANLFGTAQPPSNSVPQMGLFGTPTIGSAPTFGTQNPSIPAFEPSSPAQAPAFSFGAPQSTGIFGFGQQHPMQSQQQPSLPQSPQQSGVYSFGGTPAGAPHVQFTVGSGPNTAVRRVRKAVRRNPQR